MASGLEKFIFILSLGIAFTLCECHLSSVLGSGEVRPQFNSFVDRVNRGPSIRSNEDDPLELLSNRLRALESGSKTPAYQLRFRPNKNSQFHHSAPMSGSSSSLGQSSPFLMESDLGGFGDSSLPNEAANNNDEGEGNSESNNNNSGDGGSLDKELPTFTPYIGARALSNMGKFFEHLRENLVAMQQESNEIGQPERRRMEESNHGGALHSSSASMLDDNLALESPGLDSASASALLWAPPATGLYRERTSSERLGGRPSKYQTFIQPMSENEALLRKANNYNPSWLWTNMGLGRKRRR